MYWAYCKHDVFCIDVKMVFKKCMSLGYEDKIILHESIFQTRCGVIFEVSIDVLWGIIPLLKFSSGPGDVNQVFSQHNMKNFKA